MSDVKFKSALLGSVENVVWRAERIHDGKFTERALGGLHELCLLAIKMGWNDVESKIEAIEAKALSKECGEADE